MDVASEKVASGPAQKSAGAAMAAVGWACTTAVASCVAVQVMPGWSSERVKDSAWGPAAAATAAGSASVAGTDSAVPFHCQPASAWA